MSEKWQEHRDQIPPPKPCGSYRAGHTVHWIQAKKASAHREGDERGRIVETGADWLAVRFTDGRRSTYWNHDITRLEALMARYGPKVTVQERWKLLRLRGHLISISRVGEA